MAANAFAEWDRFNHRALGGTIFHGTAWMQAVRAAFGHRPWYLIARRGGRIVGGLPLFEVRSLLAGKLLVSVPYAVYGGSLGEDEEAQKRIQAESYALSRRVGARMIELRSERARWTGVRVVDRYVTFRRKLPDEPEDCLASLPRKARAAARHARCRHKLSVSFDDRHLAAVWRLYCDTMRRLGSLNYPFRFFQELIDRTPGGHLVSLISYGNQPVAGLVTFLFNGVAMPYFVGADARFNHLSVNNFVYLTAMERAVTEGCHTFDFGRSRRDNHGACAFKQNQGFAPTPLQYQVYTPPHGAGTDLTPSNPKFRMARRLWPLLPAWMARSLGAWLSRHIPG
ncbi:MAG: FemAB family XrtA/PEP-CTERM system-associated protein [Phycisphaerae bacterium]